jgi:hypothetical protein
MLNVPFSSNDTTANQQTSAAGSSYDNIDDPLHVFSSVTGDQPEVGPVAYQPRYLPFASPLHQRLNYLHLFLAKTNQQYSKLCGAVSPPASLELDPSPDGETSQTDVRPVIKSYLANRLVSAEGSPVDIRMTSGVVSDVPSQQNDSLITQPTDGLVAVQWYQPALDRLVRPESGAERQIAFLYMYFDKGNKKHCGARWVPMVQLRSLHHRSVIARAECVVLLFGCLKFFVF